MSETMPILIGNNYEAAFVSVERSELGEKGFHSVKTVRHLLSER